MSKSLSADDLLPLVACLPAQERLRLLRMIKAPLDSDASVYGACPPAREEFSTDDGALAWDAEGWEEFG